MITKYVCGRDWETPHVVELTFELTADDLLVAPIGHRKKTRYHLGGHYFTHKSDSTLSDTPNEAIDKVIAHLQAKIAPETRRIEQLNALKAGGNTVQLVGAVLAVVGSVTTFIAIMCK